MLEAIEPALDTLSFIFCSSLLAVVITASWMLLHFNWKASVARVFGSGPRTSYLVRPLTLNRSLSRRYSPSSTMFKHAAAKNAPSTVRSQMSTCDFAKSPLSHSTTAPLHTVSGNALKRPKDSYATNIQHNAKPGKKRTASGLARVLSSNGFEDSYLPPTNTTGHSTKSASYQQYTPSKRPLDDALHDDYELEEEQITTHDPVSYPDLSHRTGNAASLPSSSIPEMQIPWSSSPAQHMQSRSTSTSLSSFRYSDQSTSAQLDSNPRPPKRRLPWPQAQQAAQSAIKPEHKTPGRRMPTNPAGYAWDVTQSAMRKQQKTLRDANKKRVKTTEKEDSESIAIENKKKGRYHKIFLSDEQQAILDMVVQDSKSIFFTGSAGTGKSVLLREIIYNLREKYKKDPERVAITASTGLAACNIGGITLHSFAGIGIGNSSTKELIKKVKRNQKAKHRWLRTKVLIIDEVSMVDGDLYDKLEEIARTVKNNGRAFGGIQVIITGDFFQLPPVPERGRQAKFAFNANTWNTTIDKTIALHKVFRQKDPEFAGMLNEMREGRLAPSSISKFKALSRELDFNDGLEATELFATRMEVERANQMRLAQLDGETRIFEARDGGSVSDKEFRDKLLANVMAPERIGLKMGSQVMLIKNYDDTLVNGSLGKVIGFMSETEFNSYHDDEDAYLSTQAPPATRKTAGQTVVDLAGISSKYPVVRFAIADGTTRDLLCHRETWSVELPNGEVQASRSQIPLILAWALSIHKAQGQTLERVKVNLSRAFERGQAYVALSRATSMQGLQVIGFDAKKVMAHEAVRRFYASLINVNVPKPVEQLPSIPGAYPVDDPKTSTKSKVQHELDSDDAFWDSQFPDDDF